MPELNYTLLPSLPAADWEELSNVTSQLAGVSPGFQVDLVDGEFVPLKSWPFNSVSEENINDEWNKLSHLVKQFDLGLDCMLMFPEQYINNWLQLGVRRFVIHIGSTKEYDGIIKSIHKVGGLVGLALTNDISFDLLEPHIDDIDFVQLMGIAEVGQQGQPFDERTIDRAKYLREKYPDLTIAVDGSVNGNTIPLLKAAGVNRFAPGSAIAKAKNPVEAYHDLVSLMERS